MKRLFRGSAMQPAGRAAVAAAACLAAAAALCACRAPTAPGAARDAVTLAAGTRTLPAAPLGPPNPWPRFRFQFRDAPVRAGAGLSEEDRAGLFTNAVVAPLPYLMQDNYTRERRPAVVPVVRIGNAALEGVVYPSLGGRLISLRDRRSGRELLFDNPVLQFANLAIRNAWFSGGIEWNGPLYGHSLQTCSPVYAGRVDTPRGPLLRIYEFDRARETAWQVDLFLPATDDRLWIHVRAVNPNPHDVRFYWWTNIAVPLEKDTRVISPADYALSHGAAGNARRSFPVFDGFDGSFPFNYPYADSIFFRKPGAAKPWSICVDGRGAGIAHVSTPVLSGRKFFTWGGSRGGRRWMDYLSQDGRGDYIEIQGGVTPTQLQDRPLPAGGALEWTECVAPFAIGDDAARDPDYASACAAAGRAVDARVPDAALKDMDAFLSAQAVAPVRELLHRGSGWGALYQKLTGRAISPGLAFECAPSDEERPWAELLAGGTFSDRTLAGPPRSFNVSPAWLAALKRSETERGTTWLHEVLIGVAEAEAGRFAEARRRFENSARLKDNALARRNLALLDERDGDPDAAQREYERAWPLAGNDANLAVEIGDFLLRHARHEAFSAFVKSLPPAVAAHERIVLMNARLALEQGDFPAVRKLLRREFCTIREGELSLSELWFASYLREAGRREGRSLTEAEQQDLMTHHPPPREIDFRMK